MFFQDIFYIGKSCVNYPLSNRPIFPLDVYLRSTTFSRYRVLRQKYICICRNTLKLSQYEGGAETAVDIDYIKISGRSWS